MDVYSTEQEQIAQLKKWLKSYGPPVILGIVIALAIGFGWRYWKAHKLRNAQAASVAYVNMIGATLSHLDQEASGFANALVSKYPSTTYAKFASLLLAKTAVDKQQYPIAAQHLQWTLTHANNTAIKQTARIRLAKVYLAEQKPTMALNTLKTIDNKSYTGLIDETRGDAYVALKNPSKAKQAYTAAKAALPLSATAVIEMKLANL